MSKSKKKYPRYRLRHIRLSKKTVPNVCCKCWKEYNEFVPVDCYMEDTEYPEDPPAGTWYGCVACVNELVVKYNEVQSVEFGDD